MFGHGPGPWCTGPVPVQVVSGQRAGQRVGTC